ncbi:MAG: PKD domain-containing protein, partial [Trebonia sp.]
RTATQGFASGDWIYADSTYDELGRAISATAPHYAGPSVPVYTSYTAYDILDRPTQTTAPTANGGTRTVSMTYAGLKISYADTDDATGVTHDYVHYYDGLGKGNGNLVQVDQQDDDGDSLTATYRYDAGGNLTRATDPEGNAITASYDGFGDKLTLSDPDKGSWSYAYDGYGEQIGATDALHQTITTTYDVLGRKKTETNLTDHRVVAWHYDTAEHGIGALQSETVTDTSTQPVTVTYTRSYEYDADGRASGTDVTTGGLSYHSGVGYDPDNGRPVSASYPAMNGGADQPPTVSAAANPPGPVATGTAVSLDATASDPDGDALTYQWTQAANDPVQVAIGHATTAHASVTLTQAATYHFSVSVYDGQLSAQDSVTVQAESAPTASVTPSVDPDTSTTGSFSVSWNAIAGADTYQLEESKNSGAWTTPADDGATSYAASGRGAGSYRYRVRGHNAVGYGPFGGIATETVVAPPPPAAPLLSPNPSPDGEWTVQWGTVTGAATYMLQEWASGVGWTTVQNDGDLSWHTSARANGTYKYRARSCNPTTGCGSWSAVATETAAWLPATPTGFYHVTPPMAVNVGDSYSLAWDATTHASSYDLALNGTVATETGIAGTSTNETAPAQGGQDLLWRLRACGAGGCSGWSATVTVHVWPADPPPCQSPPCINPKVVQGGASPDLKAAPDAVVPAGSGTLTVTTAYNGSGYPYRLTRSGTTYATITAMDAWGHATLVSEGNGVTLTRGYDDATGLALSTLASGHSGTVANLTSAWDGFGNLAERDDNKNGSEETATYDKLNRLHTTRLTYHLVGGGTLNHSYTYDGTGNRTAACEDSDCTSYGYGLGAAGPHAVTSVNGVTSGYAWDANGEMTQDDDRDLDWTAFGKASSITQGSNQISLVYGPDNARSQKTLKISGLTTETVTYLGAADVPSVCPQHLDRAFRGEFLKIYSVIARDVVI